MRGEVVYFYAFDVANEIATGRIREVLSSQSFPYKVQTDHTYPRDVPLYQPLTFHAPQVAEQLQGAAVRLVIRIFEVGVIDIAMHVAFDVPSLADLRCYHKQELVSGLTRDELARRLCVEVCESIKSSIVRGAPPTEPEAYTVFCLADLGDEVDAYTWYLGHRREIAELLSEAESQSLSEMQVDESIRIHRSFGKRDLTVIDWDSSLIVDLDGSWEDVVYVLELANLQLEEFRVMDRRLDEHLDQMYDDLERPRRSIVGTASRTLDWVRRFRIDATKLADEVTHITKFFGDWHLARIYLGAADRFHLSEWQQSVEHRLSQLDQVYQVLQSEIYERRMLWLEIAVLICFLIDLVALIFWKR